MNIPEIKVMLISNFCVTGGWRILYSAAMLSPVQLPLSSCGDRGRGCAVAWPVITLQSRPSKLGPFLLDSGPAVVFLGVMQHSWKQIATRRGQTQWNTGRAYCEQEEKSSDNIIRVTCWVNSLWSFAVMAFSGILKTSLWWITSNFWLCNIITLLRGKYSSYIIYIQKWKVHLFVKNRSQIS